MFAWPAFAFVCRCRSLWHFPEIVPADWRLMPERRCCADQPVKGLGDDLLAPVDSRYLLCFRLIFRPQTVCAGIVQSNRCVARICTDHRLCVSKFINSFGNISGDHCSMAVNVARQRSNSPAAHWHRRNRNRQQCRFWQPSGRDERTRSARQPPPALAPPPPPKPPHLHRRNRQHQNQHRPHRRRPRHVCRRHRDRRVHREQRRHVRRQNRSRQPFL